MNRESRAADYLFLALAGTASTFLLLPTTGKVRSLKALVGYVLDPVPYYSSQAVERVADVPADVAHLISVDSENRRLREELQEGAVIRAEAEALRRENERLSAELGVGSLPGRSHRWARVMERDPASWNSSILIAAGSNEGVEMNSPVLGLHGSSVAVVGRVTEVLERTSKVLLITDRLSAVAAYLPAGGKEGLVQGEGSSRPRMNYLPVDSRVMVGDKVATSPTSVTFPPDIAIGTVSRVFSRDPFLDSQSVEITPVAPISGLKKVLVISPLRKVGQ